MATPRQPGTLAVRPTKPGQIIKGKNIMEMQTTDHSPLTLVAGETLYQCGPNDICSDLPVAIRLALRDRIAKLRFYDIAALARQVKGDTLGVDVNRKWAGQKGTKVLFADWMMGHDWANVRAICKALPDLESKSTEYYAKKGKPVPRAKPKPSKQVPVEDIPMPHKDTSEILKLAKAAAAEMDNSVQAAVQTEIAAMRTQLEKVNQARPILVTVSAPGKEPVTTSLPAQHKSFNTLLKLAATRDARGNALNIWMTGPAGSGKTTAAENVAKALDLPFQFTGAVDNEFKLLGFIDANGKCVRTPFREAYEHGGIFLQDEVDGCHAGALLALNAALANGHCDFPDGIVQRHPDCIIIAAANTWGQGATHEYVGRSKLDSASLDRYVMLAWDYDEELERNTCGNPEWARKVQAIRAKIAAHGIKHIVSPRASYVGAAMLAKGFSEDEVLGMVIRKGLTEQQWAQVNGGRY